MTRLHIEHTKMYKLSRIKKTKDGQFARRLGIAAEGGTVVITMYFDNEQDAHRFTIDMSHGAQ